ncbi:amidohydrolase [Verrucomicrobium sp. BvORR106]|uniref:M20 metallopeptidase family protein n=1 Tax=Verrucomicrobium sp. BvORR106 TaxID=1403819 RepID=UPI00056E56A9|nr:amidohydrolase [Verrucomicrobium sp. BvORR106]
MKRYALPLALFGFCTAALMAQESPRDATFRTAIDALYPKLVETRRDIHAHPELSNEEERTAALVAERLRTLGLQVKTGVAKHGVVGLLDSGKPGPCVAIRADMDALPIKELRATPYRSQNPGVMHACGHDVHTTVGLGVAELLAKHRDQWRGSVKFLFQPAEEGMPPTYKGDWGAKLMIAEGAMDNPRPAAVFGLHCRPTITRTDGRGEDPHYLRAGQVAYAIGPDSANSDSFVVTIRGVMAHGSAPQRGVDAIVVAAEAITALQTIRSRQTDTRQPLVLSVGVIQGGQRQNILADEVTFGGTVRTYDAAFPDTVLEKMHRTLKGITEANGATYTMEYRKGYPSVINHKELTNATLPSFRRLLGPDNVLEMVPGMGGEDFSYFAQVVPGFYFRLGVSNPDKEITGEIHTPAFDVDEACLKTGVAVMAAAACDFLDRN